MTERICLVGNSHLIMLQKAWNARDRATTGAEAVFFGALIRHYSDLSHDPTRGVLSASGDLAKFFMRTSGGLTEIDPAAYDRFVVVGMRIGIIEIYRMLRNFVPTAHVSGESETRQILSDELFGIWAHEFFAASAGMSVVRELCRVSGKSVTLVPQPHVAGKLLTTANGGHLPPAGDPLFAYADRVFRDAVSASTAEAGAEILFQRDDTQEEPGLSRSDYLEGAVSFSGRSFQKDDVGHMNASFGKLILEDLGMIPPS